MKRTIFALLTFALVFLVSGTMLAQVNAKFDSSEKLEQLNEVTKDKLEIQQTQSPKSINDYCIPFANCTSGDGIKDFAWAGIINYASGCSPDGYGDFTAKQASVEIGQSYKATFASGYAGQRVSMWIDFNHDDLFSETERVLTDYIIENDGVFYFVDILIPGSGLPGNTTMRIGANRNSPSSPDPCATFMYGEWEDYSVEVSGTGNNLNAGMVSIDMDPIMPSGDVTPLATVKNFGGETISFPVTMTVAETGYASTIQVNNLSPNEEIQVEFDTWNVPIGVYDVEICTELNGDELPANDCMSTEISLIDYDAGIVAINMGSIITVGNIIPKAIVKNYGFETISFPVTMTIEGANYTSTVEVTDLMAGEELLLEFDTWSNSLGQYGVEVCTELSNDENLENNCSDLLVTVSEDARQKVVMELFTGTWCPNCPYAGAALEELHQNFPATTAVISWHNNDEFEFPQGMVRDAFWNITGYPTVWCDGVSKVTGGSPSVYNTYLVKYENRINTPSDFIIDMDISHSNGTDYNIDATVELLEGTNTDNFAYFVVLTESNLSSPGHENQNFVTRNVYPDGMGLPVNFSTQSTQSFNTVITLEDEYVLENCEVVVFIQNMDTKEICQGNSLMMTDIVGINQVKATEFKIYPNPATDIVHISSNNNIQSITVYNNIGQVVSVETVGSNLHKINTSNYKSGIYFLKVFSSNNLFTRKLVVE